jgi:hypothetical protein
LSNSPDRNPCSAAKLASRLGLLPELEGKTMTRTLPLLLCLVAAATGAGDAHAQAVGARVGTTGFGAELGLGFNEYLGVRGSYGAGSFNYNVTESGIRYTTKVKPSVGLVTLDVHPFGGWFRLSGGLGLNDTHADGTADTTSGTLTINGTVYNTSEIGTVQGRITFAKTAPYLGLGWGAPARSQGGLYFTSDFGVIFSKATGTVAGTCAASLPANTCSALQADLGAEAQQFRQEVEKVKYYPVVTLGVGYRF